ncbi:hypothetical protein ACFWDI_36350 [Streptomyces sp. NPDC060064]|uniref:hypothetical protein n=1 Tax=Streptomyces sp. NPDC060064 TaxID=3347049 RepID=UPI003676D83E
MARLEQRPRRTVRRAEDFYSPPPQEPANAWDLMPPAERVVAYMERVQQRRLPCPKQVTPGEVLIARIDAGRWVAQCPHCSSAQVVSPGDPRMWCVECLPDGWSRVRFPADPAATEATVELLPSRERFWWADDDTAWNRRPPPPEPLTPKQQRAAAQRDVDNLPGNEPPADEPAPVERKV